MDEVVNKVCCNSKCKTSSKAIQKEVERMTVFFNRKKNAVILNFEFLESVKTGGF